MIGRWLKRKTCSTSKENVLKHKEGWAYYGIRKVNSKILFWNLNGRRLVREIIRSLRQVPNRGNDPDVAVSYGYEIQIDDLAQPDGKPIHGTGAIYETATPSIMNSKPTGQWNSLQITTERQKYTVRVNDIVVISNFTGNRSLEGYIGLQNHDNRSKVFFRNIKVGEIL